MKTPIFPSHKDSSSNFLLANIIHTILIDVFPAAYCFDTHIHKDCELYLILNGKCSMTIANQEIHAAIGEYVLIMPFVPHSFSVLGNHEVSCFHLHFDLSCLQEKKEQMEYMLGMDIEEYFLTHIPFFMHHKKIDHLHDCCLNILYECQNPSFDVSFANFYLMELLLLLSRDVQKNITPSATADTESIYIKKTLKYIAENYADKILLQDIAAHLNISVRYLTKVFHEKMHLSILAYINTYRIHQATLLMKQGLKLTDIAVQVGFSSHPHFTKTFTKIMAATPKQYRHYLASSQDPETV